MKSSMKINIWTIKNAKKDLKAKQKNTYNNTNSLLNKKPATKEKIHLM